MYFGLLDGWNLPWEQLNIILPLRASASPVIESSVALDLPLPVIMSTYLYFVVAIKSFPVFLNVVPLKSFKSFAALTEPDESTPISSFFNV